jgi:hypothetical protein
MTKLCNCGSCEDAITRAIALAEKMMKDDECPVFMAAISEAMAMVAYRIQRNFIANTVNEEYEKGKCTKTERDVAKLIMMFDLDIAFADLPDRIHEIMKERNDEYSADVIRICNEQRARMKQEREL